MKEVVLSPSRQSYISENVSFDSESELRIRIEPHDFKLKVGEEVITDVSWDGYIIDVSSTGEVYFYDIENNLLASAEANGVVVDTVCVKLKAPILDVQFVELRTVDYYPHCDGEYDRWGKEWVAQYSVTLETKNNSIVIG